MSFAFSHKSTVSQALTGGLALMVTGALLTPVVDAMAKILGEKHGMPAVEIAFARFILQTLMVLPLLVAFEGWAGLRTRNLGLNFLRGVLMALASVAFFAALKAMPLADAIAIFFVQPMIVTLLSVAFLKEAINLKRIAAVLVGFGGALLVIRPNFSDFGLIATLPLVCAVFFAIYLVLGRHLSAESSSLSMHFYAGVGGTVSLAVVLAFGSLTVFPEFQMIMPVGVAVWGVLLVMSVFATVTHLMFIQAYRLLPAGLLAPFGYFEIVSATVLGLVLFGDFPDLMKWLGIAIIVASGLFLIWADRETRDTAALPETI